MTFTQILAFIPHILQDRWIDLLLVGLVLWIVWHMRGAYEKWKSMPKDIEQLQGQWKSVSTDVKRLDGQLTSVSTDVKRLDRQLASVSTDVKRLEKRWDRDIPVLRHQISAIMAALSLSTKSPLLWGKSPLGLSDEGEEVAKKINADKVINDHWDNLCKLVYERNPTDAYEIQQACFFVTSSHMPSVLTKEELHKVREVAFQQGRSLELILNVFAILLRDKLLKEKGLAGAYLDKIDKEKNKKQTNPKKRLNKTETKPK